jgi:AraC family transcriptional regulator
MQSCGGCVEVGIPTESLIQSDSKPTRTIEELAEAVGYHPLHVARSLRRLTGKTIGEYVRSSWLVLAQKLLEDRTRSIAEVAYLYGFADQSHLTRLFLRCLRTTRNEIRERMVPLKRYR